MKLIPEIKRAWRFFSLQVNAINVAFLATWSLLPDKFQDVLPGKAVLVIAVVLIILGMFARLVSQKPEKTDEQKP
jgi:hypothetical protein